MKRIIMLLLLALVPVISAQTMTGDEIIKKVNDVLNVGSSYSKSEMTITTSSGKLRTFVSESWSKDNGEKNLVRYVSPRRVKDQAILMLNNADDIWAYFPRTQRVRKLATHAKKQKMQGSDFSYEDMGSGDAFINDYACTRLNDEEKNGYECFALEMTKKPESDISYSRLIMWVVKENFVPVVIQYFEENNPERVQKELVSSDIRMIDSIPTAMEFVMYNKNDDTQTSMNILEVRYNIEIKDSFFTERNLKK